MPGEPGRAGVMCRQVLLLGHFQLVQHGLHFAQSMLVTGTPGACGAVDQALFGLGLPAGAGERLRGHKVGRRVVRMVGEQAVELAERRLGFSLAGKFHSEAIARERVLRVLFEDFAESGNLVHVLLYDSLASGIEAKRPRAADLFFASVAAETVS